MEQANYQNLARFQVLTAACCWGWASAGFFWTWSRKRKECTGMFSNWQFLKTNPAPWGHIKLGHNIKLRLQCGVHIYRAQTQNHINFKLKKGQREPFLSHEVFHLRQLRNQCLLQYLRSKPEVHGADLFHITIGIIFSTVHKPQIQRHDSPHPAIIPK